MLKYTNQNLLSRIKEAYKILLSDFEIFQNFIDKFNIEPQTPRWDIACFLHRTKLKRNTELRQY